MRHTIDRDQFFPEFEAACGSATGPIGVAVSGGSDSIALLCLAVQWAEASKRELIALTVDHGLRAEAANEAVWVAAAAAKFGIAHQTLVWTSPIARQSAARRGRHVLLAEAIKAQGGNCVLLGHTFDDQLETVLMRQRQGSTWYGLAGMQPRAVSPVWPEGQGVYVARPLLSARRGALRDWLNLREQTWIDDPSNENIEYERVRVRHELAAEPDLFSEIAELQGDALARRVAEDRAIGAFMLGSVVVESTGGISVNLNDLTRGRKSRVLSQLLQIVSGKDTPPRLGKLATLIEGLDAGPAFAGATLHGVIIKHSKGVVSLRPERDPLPFSSILERLLGLANHLTGNM